MNTAQPAPPSLAERIQRHRAKQDALLSKGAPVPVVFEPLVPEGSVHGYYCIPSTTRTYLTQSVAALPGRAQGFQFVHPDGRVSWGTPAEQRALAFPQPCLRQKAQAYSVGRPLMMLPLERRNTGHGYTGD